MSTSTETRRHSTEVPHRRTGEVVHRMVGGRWSIAYGLLYGAALLGAGRIAFVQDDAFISYRYARNLVKGRGLVFNPHERVEGYTNFLWTLLHSIPEALGWSSPLFSVIVGLGLMLCSLIAMRRLVIRVFPDRPGLQFVCVAALAASVTFLGYGTSGMETMLQTLLFVLITIALLSPPTSNRADLLRHLSTGVLIGLILLVRLDSVVLVTSAVIAWFAYRWPRAAVSREKRSLVIAALGIAVPAAVILIPWLAWKYTFYGSLIPNTFFAKSSGSRLSPLIFGVLYLLGFAVSYGGFLLMPRLRRHWKTFFSMPLLRQAFWPVAVWLLYIIVVGGDFMEFRFMVPILPLLALLAGFLIDRYTIVWRQALLLIVLLSFSAAHAVISGVILPVLPFSNISHWPTSSKTSWRAMGEILRDAFPGSLDDNTRPVVAIAPLGVIPYYSDLVAIDMIGLTDTYVAQHGESVSTYYPGHLRMAPIDYLRRRNVNLIIGEPLMMDYEPGRTSYRVSVLSYLYPVVDLRDLPEKSRVIEIPLTKDTRWVVLYINQNAQVDAAIAKNKWRVLDIDPACLDSDANALIDIVGSKSCS